MSSLANRFLQPTNATHRQYEALRAHFVEGLPVGEVAGRFGYAPGTFRNLCTAFRKNPDRPFFEEPKPGRKPEAALPGRADRRRRAVELRKKRNLSVAEISETLAQENMPTSVSAVDRMLKEAGIGKLWRRTREQRARTKPEPAPVADRRALSFAPRRIRTRFGGLFLFVPDLVRCDLDRIVEQAGLPGSSRIPADCAVRSLLALKLWGIGRPYRIMPDALDEGIALFAGLNAIPKRSTLSEYSCRADPRVTPATMDAWHHAARSLGVDIGGGDSFDLDFHTIPYHGDDALSQRHYVSRRSRRQRGVLAFLARDADARIFVYCNARLRKEDQNDEILRFAEAWRQRTGTLPRELVFDSRLTTYANLARLDEMGVAFLTLRRRSRKMLDELGAPAQHWRRITLNNVGRIYRNPRILEKTVELKDYPAGLRQIAVADLGHEKPTILVTNQKRVSATALVDRYARRMVIENTIADAVDFFHMDALSAVVPLKVHFDLQITVFANTLYRIFGNRMKNGMQDAKPRTIFEKLVNSPAEIQIGKDDVVVTLSRRANNPLLLEAGYEQTDIRIPWLAEKRLRFRFY